ncbi:uncharacterized protein LOC101855204 [Aplysia californica]|uniref:Uncharacterized protein LOC101855204 n=1 Tax=Aplysia californica TaxID=6500 RepID=A0ABM1VXG5_APLCA|nr:uncharacterized protein LOC101855204 [Aplysia californica]
MALTRCIIRQHRMDLTEDLHQAIMNDKDREAIELVKLGADVNAVWDHETAFTRAAQRGHLEVMQAIYACPGFDPNAMNSCGKFPLYITANKGLTHCVEELLSLGADINLQIPEGDTPLAACSYDDCHETAQVLIRHGANIDTRDVYGITPLYLACSFGSVNCVRVLTESGCDVNIVEKEPRITPLMKALSLLRNSSEPIDKKISDVLEICQMLINAGCRLDDEDLDEYTALHHVVENRDVFGLCLLAESGCNLETHDENCQTPLKKALDDKEPVFEIARFLVYYGAKVHNESFLDCVHDYSFIKMSALAWLIEKAPFSDEHDELRERYLLLKVLREATYPHFCCTPSELDLPQDSPNQHFVDKYMAVEREATDWMCSLESPVSLEFQARVKIRKMLGVRNTLSKIDSLPIGKYLKSYLMLGLEEELPLSRSCMVHAYIRDREHKKLKDLVQSGANVNFMVHGKTPLAAAVILKNLKAFRILFSTGRAYIGQHPVNEEGDTPLHLAAAYGFVNIIDNIIHAGGSVKAINLDRYTPLVSAVTAGHFEVASLLIRRGAEVKGQETLGYPLLHLAAASHNIEVVQMMLERGIEANLRDHQRNTPLHIVASQAKIYLDQNVYLPALHTSDVEAAEETSDVSTSSDEETEYDMNKNSPEARRTTPGKEKYQDVARLLLEHGADVRAYNSESLTPLDVVEKGDDPVLVDILKNITMLQDLHKALLSNEVEEAKQLIESGADVNAVYLQETAFTRAVKLENLEVTQAIFARPDFDPNAKTWTGRSPLYITASRGLTRCVEELLSLGANVNQQNPGGETPLTACCSDDFNETAQVLIRHGANINTPDFNRINPLYRACHYGSVNCVRVLTDNGCDVKIVEKESRNTPLIAAALSLLRCRNTWTNKKISDMLEICQMLIDAGCDVDAQDSIGRTALHHVVEKRDVFGLCLLAENGCNLETRDENQQTPLKKALLDEEPAFEIARLLVYYGANVHDEIMVNCGHGEVGKSPLAWVIEHAACSAQHDKLRERYLLMRVLMEATYPNFCGISSMLVLLQVSQNQQLVDQYRAIERETVNKICSPVPASLEFQARLKLRKMLGVRNTLSRIDSLPVWKYLKRYLMLGLEEELPLSRSCMVHVYIRDREDKKLKDLVQSGANVNFMVDGKTPLASAVMLRNMEAFRILFSTGRACIGQYPVNEEGDTLLHIAAANGFVNIIDDIIHAGCTVKSFNNTGFTPLRSAVTAGHFEVASLLIRRGADVKGQEMMTVPLLHLAAASRNIEVVKMMLERGVEANLRDHQGNTPLHIVASQANIYLDQRMCLPALYRSNFKKTLDKTDINLNGNKDRPTVPGKEKYQDVARLLLKHGADVRAYNSESLTPLDVAEKGDDPVLVDILKKTTPSPPHPPQLPECHPPKDMTMLEDLHKALMNNKVEETKQLIESGANVNAVCQQETAFTRAVQHENFEIMDMIMECHDFDPNAKNVFDRSPLFVTARKGYTLYVKELLSMGAYVNQQDAQGVTPLGACCWEDFHETAEELIQHDANKNTPDLNGETPLYRACFHTSINCVRVLIEKGCDVNIANRSGETPLIVALPPILYSDIMSMEENISVMLEICQLVINAGCNLDAQDSRGRTALHYAVESGHVSGLCLLAEHGCNLEICDEKRQTPFQKALLDQTPAFEIARFLVYFGANCREEISVRRRSRMEMKSPLALAIEAAPLESPRRKLRERYLLLRVLMEATYPYLGGLSTNLVLPQVSNIPHPVDPYRAVERKSENWMLSRIPASLKFQTRLKLREMLGVRNTLSKIDSLPIGKYLKSYLMLGLEEELPLSRSCMMHEYIKDRENKKLEDLVRNGAHVNFMVDGKTPLARAIMLKNLEAFRILVSSGVASIGHDPINENGDKPLHLAAAYGFIDVIDNIINAGGSVNAPNKRKRTPLHSAVAAGHFEVASLLIRRGAEVKDQETMTVPLLHMAAASHNIEVVQMMLERGVETNLRDHQRNTPLHIVASQAKIYLNQRMVLPALYKSKLEKNLDMVLMRVSNRTARPTIPGKEKYRDVARLLLEHGAYVRACNSDSLTPLDVVERGDDPIPELLSMGACVNQQDAQGVTPLGACCWEDFHETAEELIQHDANINTPDLHGETPLYHACFHTSINCVRVLIEKGCDVNIANNCGETPLMAALPPIFYSDRIGIEANISCILEICQKVINAGCNLDAQDSRGRTALHCAVVRGHVSGLCLLAEHGCNLEICDEDRQTPFQKALLDKRPLFEVARFLVYYGANCRQEINVCRHDRIEMKSPLALTIEAAPLGGPRGKLRERYLLLRVLMEATYPYLGGLSTNLVLPQVSNIPHLVDPYRAVERETENWMRSEVPASLKFQARLKLREMLGVRNTLSKIDSLPIGKYLKSYLMLDLEKELPLSRSCMLHEYIKDRENKKLGDLVRNGAHVNFMVDGKTPLAAAVILKNLEAFRILVSSGVASIGHDPINENGDEPLHLAAIYGFIDVIDDIISAGGSVNAPNKRKRTPLHYAVTTGHFEVASLLIRRGAEVKGQETLRFPLLHRAAASHNIEVVKMMLEGGVAANLRDYEGNTPLHIVASQANIYLEQRMVLPALYNSKLERHLDMVIMAVSNHAARPTIPGKEKYRDVARLLLEHGADVKAYNSDSFTPLDEAEIGGDPVLIDIIKNRA